MAPRNRKKQILTLFLALFIVGAIGAGVYLLLQEQDTRSNASAARASFLITPATITKAVNEEFDLTIVANPDSANGGSALAVDLILKFDPSKVSAQSVTKGATAGTYPFQGKPEQIDNTAGTVKISWLAYNESSSTVLPAITAPSQIGVVKFKVKAEGGNSISVKYDGATKTTDSNIVTKEGSNAVDILGSNSTAVLVNGGIIGGDDGGDDTGDDGGDDTGDDGGDDTGDDGGDDGGGSEPKPGDVNGDGKVSLADYSLFVNDYLLCRDSDTCNPRSDFNDDGNVSLADYTIFLNAYLEEREG